MPAFYEQKELNFREEPVEVSISELSIRRSGVYFRGSGLAVDTAGQTSIDGLFAAGDCATVSGGIAGASVVGHIAGEGVASLLENGSGAQSSLPSIDMSLAEAIRSRATAHMQVDQAQRLSWKTHEDRVRRTVTDYVGVRRNDKGCGWRSRPCARSLPTNTGSRPTTCTNSCAYTKAPASASTPS